MIIADTVKGSVRHAAAPSGYAVLCLLAVLSMSCSGFIFTNNDNTCVHSIENYDMNLELAFVEEGSVIDHSDWHIEISGQNYSGVAYDDDGKRHEIVHVANKAIYSRSADEAWQVMTDTPEPTDIFPYNLSTSCPPVEGFEFKGEETHKGKNLSRYAAPAVTGLSDKDVVITFEAWEYLVDENGILIRAVNSVDDYYGNYAIVYTYEFSGWGEVNAVSDPLPGGTATPSATSTPNGTAMPDPTATSTAIPTPTPAPTPVSIATPTP